MIKVNKLYEIKPYERGSLAQLFCNKVFVVSVHKEMDTNIGRKVENVHYKRVLSNGSIIEETCEAPAKLFLEYYQVATEKPDPEKKKFKVTVTLERDITRIIEEENEEAAIRMYLRDIVRQIRLNDFEWFRDEFCKCSAKEVK